MALPSGLAAQFGWAEETTWGTPVTVDTFVPLISESMTKPQIDRIKSSGIIAGRTIMDVDQIKTGNRTVSGDVQLEAYEQSVGTLLKHALGTASTTGAGPYTHTLTPGDLTGLGLTVQIGVPGTGGTVHPFTFEGCKVNSAEIGFAAGEVTTLGVSFLGKDCVTNTSLESASYAAQATRPLTGIEATTTTWGGSNIDIRSGTLSVNNNLADDRRNVGTAVVDEPLQAGDREVTGSLTAEFEDLSLYNDFAVVSFADLVVTITNGTESLGWTAHADLTEVSPSVDGKGIVTVDVPYEVAGDGSDADGITLTYVSDDATI